MTLAATDALLGCLETVQSGPLGALITSLLVSAPDPLRAKYRSLKQNPLVKALAACRPGGDEVVAAAVLVALKTLAKRHQFLTAQADELEAQIDVLVTMANPALRAAFGVGPDTAAQLLITAGGNPERLGSEASFAALCGAAPVQASSGKTQRHRLSRGGDRGGNSALHRIALVRMSCDPRTREYVARHVEKNKSKAAILRMLKRAIAREMLRPLTNQIPIGDYNDLRPARQSKNITLTAVAQEL